LIHLGSTSKAGRDSRGGAGRGKVDGNGNSL